MSGHEVAIGTEKDMLAGVRDIIIAIPSRLEAQEKGMEELKAAREEAPERVQNVSTTWQPACTGREHSQQ